MSRRNRRRGRRQTEPEPEITVDVAERGDEFVVTADLPGIRKQNIDVRVRNDRVQILADPEADDEGGGVFANRARDRGSVSRTVRLPERVDEKRTNGEYLNGRLTITLPKRERRRSGDVE
jgi:HSP20 family protein